VGHLITLIIGVCQLVTQAKPTLMTSVFLRMKQWMQRLDTCRKSSADHLLTETGQGDNVGGTCLIDW